MKNAFFQRTERSLDGFISKGYKIRPSYRINNEVFAMNKILLFPVLFLSSLLYLVQPVLAVGLWCDPASVGVGCLEGEAPLPVDLIVRESTLSTNRLNVQVYSRDAWISLDPQDDSCTGVEGEHATFAITFLSEQMDAGAYTGAIAVVSEEATNVQVDIPVIMTLTAAQQVIRFSPQTAHEAIQAGSSESAAFYLDVWNGSSLPVPPSMSYNLTPMDGWISVSNTSGSSSGNVVRHSYYLTNMSALVAGTYTGRIEIYASGNAVNDPSYAPVVLNVLPPAPVSAFSTNRLYAETVVGIEPMFYSWLVVSNAGGSMMTCSVSFSKSSLSASQTPFTVAPGAYHDLYFYFQDVTLEVGHHVEYARITTPGTDPDYELIALEVEVFPSSHTLKTTGPYAIEVTVPLNSGIYTQQFEVWNASGPASIDYDVWAMSDPGDPWLDIVPATGVATDVHSVHDLLLDPSGKTEGRYENGLISVNAFTASNSPLDVAIYMVVPTAFTVTPSSLDVFISQGEQAADATIRVWNAGSFNTVGYTLSGRSNDTWLSSASGMFWSDGMTNEHPVMWDTASLECGVYQSAFTIAGTGQTIRIPVKLVVGSPFGAYEERILFSALLDGDSDIWSIRPDGSGLRKIYDTAGQAHMPHVSYDGAKLIYYNGDTLTWFLVDLITGQAEAFDDRFDPRWSHSERGGLWARVDADYESSWALYDADGVEQAVLAEQDRKEIFADDAEDGIVYYARRSKLNNSTELKKMDLSTGALSVVLPGTGHSRSSVDYDPMGGQIVYCEQIRYDGPYVIKLIETSGRGPFTISRSTTNSYHSCSFSPDGSQVAVMRKGVYGGGAGLYILQRSGGLEWSLLEHLPGTLYGGLDWGYILVINPTADLMATGYTNQLINGSASVVTNTFTVRNAGDHYLNYSLTSDVDWVWFDGGDGVSTGETDTVQLLAGLDGLGWGVYTANVTVSFNGTNAPQSFPLVLDILPRPAVLRCTTNLVSAALTSWSPVHLKMSVWNEGEALLDYALSSSTNWLGVNPSTGLVTTEKDPFSLSLDPGGLSSGIHTGVVVVIGAGQTGRCEVVFDVRETASVYGELGVSTSSLATNTPRYHAPKPLRFFVHNEAGEGLLHYYMTNGQSWCVVTPSTAEDDIRTLADGIAIFEVDCVSENLSPGVYRDTIAVFSSNGTEDVSVVLTVNDPLQYTLTVTTSGVGSVTVSPVASQYTERQNVWLQALAGEGYCFDHWIGPTARPARDSLMETVTNHIHLHAVFKPATYVYGTVSNAITGEKLSGARVLVHDRYVTTDDNGNYSATSPSASDVLIKVSRKGFVSVPAFRDNLTPHAGTRRDFGLQPNGLSGLTLFKDPVVDKIVLHYVLEGEEGDEATVAVSATAHNGGTPLTVATLWGQYGAGIQADGDKKLVVWQAKEDLGHIIYVNAEVHVTARGQTLSSDPFTLYTAEEENAKFRIYFDHNDNGHYDAGEEVSGAEFYLNHFSTVKAVSDSQGLVSGMTIKDGVPYFARKLIHTRSAVKAAHGMVDDIMRRLWIDSDVGPGAEGELSDWDGVWDRLIIRKEQLETAARGGVIDVELGHALFEWNLIVDYLSTPSIPNFMDKLKLGVANASKYLYHMSYGQMKYHKFYLTYQDAAARKNADVEIHPDSAIPTARISGIYKEMDNYGAGCDINLYEVMYGAEPDGFAWGNSLVHEFGHYGLGFGDEYQGIFEYQAQSKFSAHRHVHPNLYPQNYGCMDDHTQPSGLQMSAPNDYPPFLTQLYEGIHAGKTNWMTTEQGFACWDDWKNGYVKSYNGYAVKLYGPKPGEFVGGRSTTEDRMSSTRIPRPYSVCEIKEESGSWTPVYKTTDTFSGQTEDMPVLIRVQLNGNPAKGARLLVRGGPRGMYTVGTTDDFGEKKLATIPMPCEIRAYVDGRDASRRIDKFPADGVVTLDLSDGDDGKRSQGLGDETLGMVIAGAFYAPTLYMSLEVSQTLTTNPTVTAYQRFDKEYVTNELTVTSTGVRSYEVALDTSQGGEGYVEISCTSTAGESFVTLDVYQSFLASVSNGAGNFMASPTDDLCKHEVTGVVYQAYGPVFLPPSSSEPTNQIGPAVAILMDGFFPMGETTGVWLNLAFDDEDSKGIDLSTVLVRQWQSSGWKTAEHIAAYSDGTAVYATNHTAFVVFGDTSADITPPAAIDDLIAVTGVAPWSVRLEWTASGDDGTNGAAYAYDIRSSTNDMTEAVWSNTPSLRPAQQPRSAGLAESWEGVMSRPDALYWFAVRAVDEVGNMSPWTTSVMARTSMVDNDNNGLPDQWEDSVGAMGKFDDVDNDGLTTWEEYLAGTDPNNADSDGDGMSDGYEVTYGLNPLNAADRDLDEDGDDLTNYEESQLLTDPFKYDTDGDGMSDGWENRRGLDNLAVNRENGATDDPDEDDFTNFEEYVADTDPTNQASFFFIDDVTVATNTLLMQFHGSSTRRYWMERTTHESYEVWESVGSEFSGDDAPWMQAAWPATNGAPFGIYRLRVRKP